MIWKITIVSRNWRRNNKQKQRNPVLSINSKISFLFFYLAYLTLYQSMSIKCPGIYEIISEPKQRPKRYSRATVATSFSPAIIIDTREIFVPGHLISINFCSSCRPCHAAPCEIKSISDFFRSPERFSLHYFLLSVSWDSDGGRLWSAITLDND